MTKKQAGIICTLLALIVCTALLAARLNNGGLNDPTDLSTIMLTEEDKNNIDKEKEEEEEEETETLSTQDFFYNSRSEREQKDATTMQNLKAIVDNANTSEEQKVDANKEIQKITLKQDKQKTIELNLKNKGYEEALCEISENQDKASIIVKIDELSEGQGAEIQEIVENASNIKEVTIQSKK